MGEHRSPHRSPSLCRCLQEGRFFYILSCGLRFLFTFPILPKPPWLELTALLFPALRTAFTSWKGDEFADAVLRLHFSSGGPVATGDRHREADLHPSPCTGSGSKHAREMLHLIHFKVLLHEWDVWLDQTNFVT